MNKYFKNKASPSEENMEGMPKIGSSKKIDALPFIVIVGIAGLVIYFIFSHGEKKLPSSNAETYQMEGSATPLKGKKNTPEKPSPVVAQTNPVPLDAPDIKKAIAARLDAPLLMFGQKGEENNKSVDEPKKLLSADANINFLNQVGDNASVFTSEASRLNHRNTLITQGTLIHAVLESAIDSDLPGYLRAIVSEPVYADDGAQVLIPSGSRLIGEYKSQMQNGQSRVFIVWSRVITPQGLSVMVGSPNVDTLGKAGLAADNIDRHFWQIFGTASLLSIMGAGVSNTGVGSQDAYNAKQAYREAVAESFEQTARHTLQEDTRIPPTLHVNQGALIHVFVIRDIQFDKALVDPLKKINVF